MLKIYLITISFLCSIHWAWALPVSSGKSSSSRSGRHSFFLGVDAYSRSLFKTTSSDSAKKDTFSSPQFPFSASYVYKLNEDSRIWSELLYTPFPKKGKDGGTEETHFFLKFPYSQRIGKSIFEWKAGLVFHQTRIAGQGGTATLNNGTGTAQFALPGENRTTSTLFPEIGVNLMPLNWMVIHSSLLIEAPFNSKTRTLSLMLGIQFNVGSL